MCNDTKYQQAKNGDNMKSKCKDSTAQVSRQVQQVKQQTQSRHNMCNNGKENKHKQHDTAWQGKGKYIKEQTHTCMKHHCKIKGNA